LNGWAIPTARQDPPPGPEGAPAAILEGWRSLATRACENGSGNVPEQSPEPNLDDRFRELRLAMEDEISRARSEVIAELARSVSRMRGASNEAEWRDAVLDCGRAFSSDPEALDLIASLATLTAPAAPRTSNGAMAAMDGIEINTAAQRFARVRIAEIQLYYSSAVKAGRAGRDLYGSLGSHIEAAREAFRERFLKNGTSSADYLHAEIVHALANDDATLLGPDYPGPLA